MSYLDWKPGDKLVCIKPMDSSSGIDWLVCRFRPVTKCTTSISIFTQMLNPSKVDA